VNVGPADIQSRGGISPVVGDDPARTAGAGRRTPRGASVAAAAGVPDGAPVRVGFLPLTDGAPVIAAYELGYFREAGLAVALERQIGWANVRDKLQHGHLDASHALLGIPVGSAIDALGGGGATNPILSVMSTSRGGNGITLSRRLVERGVTSAALLRKWVHDAHSIGRPVLAHVFRCSTHHYLLRAWLDAGGVDPDADVRLCVIPPEQMSDHMGFGHLDGFCVGEPWNTLAARGHFGSVVAATTDVLPDHPEKVLAVAPGWAARNPGHVVALARGVIRACAWCEDPANGPDLADMLAPAHYVDAPVDAILAGLRVGPLSVPGPRGLVRPTAAGSGAAASSASPRFTVGRTFPCESDAAWVARQMTRWGHAPPATDAAAIARACTDARFYRSAAASLAGSGIRLNCPPDDAPGSVPARPVGEPAASHESPLALAEPAGAAAL
jgi:ABC-type nitrate/sulfonate/bicarbonate transport system substrate-binding protein